MAKKRNVEAYGKSWSPIDIQNLEKAVKLYERLNYLNDHFADSLSGSNNIWKQINEKAEIQEELQKLGIKHSKEQCEYVIRLANNQEKVNSKILTANELAKNAMGSSTNNSGFSLSNAGAYFTQNRLQNDASSALEHAIRSAGQKVRHGAFTKNSTEYTNYVNNLATEKLALSANKYSTAANIIQLAANTFSDAVSVFGKLFSQGYNKQRQVYEDTFTNISVRNNVTRGQYFGAQANTNNILSSMGLFNNVRTSQVQSMWNTFASSGLNVDLSEAKRAQTIANAIETVVTSTIVPYLDVSSAYFQQLSEQQPGLMKQIRGIGLATQDLAGSSVFVNKYLQDMVDSLGPMASLAENQLGVQFAQMSGTYESLRAQGLSDATIGELYKGSAALYNDPLAALRSNNLDLQIAAAQGLANQIDFRDIGQVSNQYINSANWLSNWMPEGKMSPFFSGMTNTMLSTVGKTELNERNLDIISAIITGNNVANSLNRYANLATSNFSRDVNQTAKTLQEVTTENIMNEVAVISQQLGYWGDILAGLLKGIMGLIGAKLIGSIGGKLLGIGGTSFASTALGYNALGVGASLGINSTAGATAAGLALPAAIAAGGIAGGAYGIKEGVRDFKTGHNVRGTISTAGGVAMAAGGIGVAGGMLAAGAANAWNPVGWGLLIAGGLAVAATAIHRATDTTVNLADDLEQEKKIAVQGIKDYNEQTIDSMYDVREAIKQATSYEEAKNIALQSGIISQQDLNNATDKSVEALLKLADISIEDQKHLNDLAEQTVSAYEDVKNEIKTSAGEQLLGVINTAKAGGRGYKDLSEDEKTQMNQFMQAYIKYAKESGLYDSNEDVKWRIDQWGTAFDDGNFHENDFNVLFEGNNAVTSQLFEQFVASDAGAKILSGKSSIGSLYGKDNYYSTLTADKVNSYIMSALTAGDIEGAKKYLKVLKNYGMTWDKLPSATRDELSLIFGEDIKSYRKGLNKVPYDNYLANLHEGEAVLTASTAGELRNLITTFRETNNQGFVIDAAISNQTVILVNKLDEVVKAVQNINGVGGSGSAWNSELKSSMRSMTNTKVFG